MLLIGSILVLSVSAADARPWGRQAKSAESVPAASANALTAVEVDGSRVLLRTSGAPAYTSYSPSPGVFVIDLTGTSRDAAVAMPAPLPPAIESVTAEEVVEMGSRLTRVTLRISGQLKPEVAAIEQAVVVSVPGASAVAETRAEPITAEPHAPVMTEVVPEVAAVDPVIEAAIEPIAGPVEEPVVDVAPVVAAPTVALAPARTVKRIGATTSDGNVEVWIAGDGALKYKAFRLEKPSRLVIDLEGVRNASPMSTVSVDDDIVKRVRVAQFNPKVARVVVDLTEKSTYDIAASGDQIRIAFGGATASAAAEAAAPAPVERVPPARAVARTEPASPPVVTTAAAAPVRERPRAAAVEPDIPARVPVVAENAPGWSVPKPASEGARKVINSAADQAPPVRRPPVQEDVFSEAAQVAPAPATQTLSRTLSAGQRVFTGEPFSLHLKDADIRDVLSMFAELTGLNMAIDPGVSGRVTVDFTDVPWDQALDLILRQNNLAYVLEGNVMRIGTIERLSAETVATRRLAEEERLNVPLTTLSVKLSYARAPEVAGLLRDIASSRARIIVDQRTNQLIVSEVPEYLLTMQNLITTVDIPTRQVMIEARIVESSRTFAQQWGFNWGFGGDLDPALGTGTGLVFPNRVGFDAGPFEFGIGNPVLSLSFMDVLGTFDLDLALLAAESQGFVKVVSAPRVTTQDNQAAEIQSGFQIPYQTRVNFTTTVTYLDATLRLSVTPQITEAGTVIMEIAVQKNEPATGLAIAGAAGTPLTTRMARTRLMVRDGGTAVIAGIFQTKDNDAESRVPFVHNIPILGALFRSHDINTSHDELLIFITPRIVRG